jgi:hypothetical protein
MFDEASDISMNNMLNIFVNLLLPNGVVLTLILTLCELEAADATTVYNTLMQVLQSYDVPLQRVIGICSDGANTMQGVHRGVCTRLARHIRELRGRAIASIRDTDQQRGDQSFHVSKGIFVNHCVCHRLALILTDAIKGSKACEPVIPDECINLLTSLHGYFCKSHARKAKLRRFINAENAARTDRLAAVANLGVPMPDLPNPDDELERILKVLEERTKLPRRIVLTRWLSSAEAVKVVLSCRDAYTVFFAHEETEDGRDIYDILDNNNVIAWYACLQDVLPVLTCMNILFQSSLPLPHLLYPRIVEAKATLINMVGRGRAGTSLLPVEDVTYSTPFGAFANNFILGNSQGRCKGHGRSLTQAQVKELKVEWHKLFAHCIKQLDTRFPPASMLMFKHVQIIDPSKLQWIGEIGQDESVSHLLHMFELPLHVIGKYTAEEIKNSFTAYRSTEAAKDLWSRLSKTKVGQAKNLLAIYSFYKELMDTPALAAWSFFALFLLVLPTGNALAERGFSAMGAAHSKNRSELSHEQVLAHMLIGFNGPSLTEFKSSINLDSKAHGTNWWGYVAPCNYNK